MPAEANDNEVPTCSFAEWALLRLRQLAAQGKVAQIFADDGSSWSYEELLRHSVHVGAGLESAGISRGDMVSIVARNSHELFALALGCVFADVTLTPSVPELSANELRQNLLVVKPKFVIAGEPSVPAVEEALDSDEFDQKPKILEVKKLFKETTAKGMHADPATFKPAHMEDPRDHVFTCIFSSGTTGKQKAVTLTDFGTLRSVYLARIMMKNCSGPYISTSQANWVSWWFGVFRCFLEGWTRLFFDKVDTFKLLDAVHKFKPDIWIGLPSAISSMATVLEHNPGRWDISSLKLLLPGGEALSSGQQESLSKRLKVDIFQMCSSTETGVLFCSRNDLPVVYGSVGTPVVPVKLIDVESGVEIKEANRPGEVVVEDVITKGYYNNPEANAGMYDVNGWYKTGDVAIFDENGNFFMVDRIKEMFKYKGFQISPNELEDIIKTIPGVKEAAVVGKDAGLGIGQVPAAFVVQEENANLTEQDIQKYLEKENPHDSKKLRGGVIFTDRLPRNGTGKLVRMKLRALVNESRS